MKTPLHTLEQTLRSVANKRRLAILRELRKNKTMTVGELSKAIRLGIAATSQHLRILKAAEIVENKKRGKYVAYRLSLRQDEPIRAVLSALNSMQ